MGAKRKLKLAGLAVCSALCLYVAGYAFTVRPQQVSQITRLDDGSRVTIVSVFPSYTSRKLLLGNQAWWYIQLCGIFEPIHEVDRMIRTGTWVEDRLE